MSLTAEITRDMVIKYNGEPHLIVDKEFYAPAKGGSFSRTKLRNLKTGQVINRTFRTGEKFEEMEVDTKSMQFIYSDENSAYFMDPESFEQLPVSLSRIPGRTDFLHTEAKYLALVQDGEIISIQLPPKITVKVTDTTHSVRGNTVTNTMKEATIETGAKVHVPLFVNVGDKVIINTETGKYFSKAEK